MRKRFEWKWELLEEFGESTAGGKSSTSRAKVIGGWLLHHYFHLKNTVTESMTFVPDHNHEWEILPPPKPEVPTQKQLATDFQSPESKF